MAQSGLDYMRSRTLVDCDTLDEEGVFLIYTYIACPKLTMLDLKLLRH